jgi:hypothetical protein
VGEAIHGAEALYQEGAAEYDEATGDEEGARHHHTEAAVDAVEMIPGVSEVSGVMDFGLATTSAISNAGHELDPDVPVVQPTSVAEAIADARDYAEPNLPADGTGTSGGEVAAGLSGGAMWCLEQQMPGLYPAASKLHAGDHLQNLLQRGLQTTGDWANGHTSGAGDLHTNPPEPQPFPIDRTPATPEPASDQDQN